MGTDTVLEFLLGQVLCLDYYLFFFFFWRNFCAMLDLCSSCFSGMRGLSSHSFFFSKKKKGNAKYSGFLAVFIVVL